jgi:hypothetical protein
MKDTRKPSGPAAAALVAAGVGVFVTGLLTTLAEVSPALRGSLNWWNPAGPLSGKTGVGIIVWLVAWVVLHAMYKQRDVALARPLLWTWILIALGFLGTFPPFFEAFAP